MAITLVAELGTVRSSVGELQTLAAGCVLEVGERNPGEVTLRYRGLKKNTAKLGTLFALSNLWMARGRLLAAQG